MRRAAAVLCLLLFCLAGLTAADPEPTPRKAFFSVTLEKAPEAPSKDLAPGKETSPTLTPECTYVPLPTDTPDALGRTPTPAPPKATPYPSPTGEKLVPETEEAGADTVLTVGSLNIHGCRSTGKIDAIASVLREKGPDVVGLQEVYRSNMKGTDKTDWLKKLAEAAGYPYLSFTRTIAFKAYDYGLAILSRYPIEKELSLPLDGFPGEEPRSLQYAAVRLESGTVHICNTHLSASVMYKKSINIASMVYTLRRLGMETYAVTGDFNCSPPRIHEYMPDIRFANVTETTFGDGSVPKILDNVLYAGRFLVPRTEIVPIRDATDHSLVIAELHIR